MRIVKMSIDNFRGIKQGAIHFNEHTVLMGTNNTGKSTVIDAIAMVLGRERLVRSMTEHDFYGSNPCPDTRIKIVVTITDFYRNDPDYNYEWFRDGRAVPKWWNPRTKEVGPVQASSDELLCVEIGFAARFDQDTLTVETLRYFHDDDSIIDPFLSESITKVPGKLLVDFGFFLVPVSRTWDKLISFGSEIFRKLVASNGGIPSTELLKERDNLREPATPLESIGDLGQLIVRVNRELAGLFPKAPEIRLRVTSTDSDSLLNSIVPHFAFDTGAVLPAGRNGSGLLSLQVLMLLLEFGKIRKQSENNFVLAIEEPELHLPHGIQKRLIYRSQSVAGQTIVTSHASNIVAFYPATSILLLENKGGHLTAHPLLDAPLQEDTPNGVRKLFLDNRHDLVASLMQEFVLIPEGKIDFEWFRLLVHCTETKESWDITHSGAQFGTLFGVIPTHDAAIFDTYQRLSKIRKQLVVVVDGDSDGDRYIQQLLDSTQPPMVIIQWPRGWVIEDVLFWIISVSHSVVESVSKVLECDTENELLTLLKSDRKRGGIKGNYLVYEEISSIISSDSACIVRARTVLDNFVALVSDPQNQASFDTDARSIPNCVVRVWKP